MVNFLLSEQEQQEEGLIYEDFHTKIQRKIYILMAMRDKILLNIEIIFF